MMDINKVVLCVVFMFGLWHQVESQILELNSTNLPNHGICYSMDIRNHPKNLERLRNCSVIIGSLNIVLIDFHHDYSQYVYPELREITQYLLIYRLKSMTSLGKMFPNLSLIRGQRLFLNYALIIYEMPQLTEVNLHSLMTIKRGCVRIEKNPQLCFARTIDWAAITNATDGHFLTENGNRNCPDPEVCHICEKKTCWNEEFCQNYPSTQCHRECLGGCNTNGHCYHCKNYFDNGLCVSSCPQRKFYVPATFECVTRDFCNTMYKGLGWVFENQCIKNCPIGYRQDRKKSGSKTCVFCGDQCNIVCQGSEIISVEQAQAYTGCHFVNGSLIIKLFGEFTHKEIIMKELEDSLGGIREIQGYLKVHYSPIIPSLSFLKNLTVIRGDELYHGRYAFIIRNMENLRTIWDFDTKKFTIDKGFLFASDNPALCLSEIRKLANQANIVIYPHDVSGGSNGNRAPCHLKTLQIETVLLGEKFATIKWERYITPKNDSKKIGDVGYMVHFYRNAVEGETTHRYNTEGCVADGWDYIIVPDPMEKNSETISVNLTNLTPFTTYAVYIQTYDKSYNRHASDNSEEGESDMIFFKTKVDSPPIPSLLEAVSYSSDALTLYWAIPPKYANAIYQYTVDLYIEHDHQNWYDMINYCEKPLVWEVPASGPKYNIEAEVNEIERDYQGQCKCREKNWNKQVDTILEEYDKDNSEKLNIDDFCSKRIGPGEIGTYEDFLRGLRCGHITIGGSGEGELDEHDSSQRTVRETKHRDFDIRKLLDLDDTDLLKHPSENITINNKYMVFATNFSGPNKNYTINNLKHFSKYILRLVACTKDDELKCSSTAITALRTLSDLNADRIVEYTIIPINESVVEMSWKHPKEPNGAVLYYVIQYRRKDSNDGSHVDICISNLMFTKKKGKFNVINLLPGEYEFRVRIATLGGRSNGFDWQTVILTESKTYKIVWTLLGIVLGICVGLSLWYIISKRKEHQRVQDDARALITPPEVRSVAGVRYTVRRRYEDEDDSNPIQIYNPEDDE